MDKLAKQLANALLSANIGVNFHPFNSSKELVDMPKEEFQQLRILAQKILDFEEIK